MKPAHRSTLAAHQQALQSLDFSDTRDFDDAARGFLGTRPDAHIDADQGGVAWSLKPHEFLQGEAPATVHPSLWRLSRLNALHGLFKVTERIYQVRGFCLANITFIEGDTGLIVVDPLTFVEHARAALALYREHRGDRPVRAIFYTHSHRDHYGGARGVIPPEEVEAEGIPILAPAGFTEEAFSETILAGVPMRRRSLFQFGTTLPPGPMGHVDSGLGKAVGRGADGFLAPNWLIREPLEKHLIDGVEVVFQLTPGAEAPAEMNMFYPGLRALNMAENACQTLHNLCPLRGAKTRDALAWSRYLDEALDAFVPFVDVVFAQHHWPVWGRERMQTYLAGQRDMYRFLHDQTLRLMSHGLTPAEIGERLLMPNALSRQWFARGYYGAVTHNVAAIYAHYMGPYDGNPAHLHPLPPESAAENYVRYMGGADAVMARAQEDFQAGHFRWVVQVLDHLIFQDRDHLAARELSADAMEQLGYQSESATWRNAYLQGARELRQRKRPGAPASLPIGPDMLALLPLARFLEFLAIRSRGEAAQSLVARIDWTLLDAQGRSESQRVTLSNGALHHLPGTHAGGAEVVVRTQRSELPLWLGGPDAILAALDARQLDVRGDLTLFRRWVQTLETFDPMFNVVEP